LARTFQRNTWLLGLPFLLIPWRSDPIETLLRHVSEMALQGGMSATQAADHLRHCLESNASLLGEDFIDNSRYNINPRIVQIALSVSVDKRGGNIPTSGIGGWPTC